MANRNDIDKSYFLEKALHFWKQTQQIEHVSTEEVQKSWQQIEMQMFKGEEKQKRVRTSMLYLRISSVAAITLLLIALSYLAFRSPSPESSLSAGLPFEEIRTDSIHEITLISDDKQSLLLEDRSTLSYDPDGRISVNQQMNVASATDEQKESNLNKLLVPKGKRINLVLSDGTKVYVNAGSTIIYPSFFDKNKREITVEGEVYLEVAHDPDKPFYVKTSDFNVKVLGTTFNISAYRQDRTAAIVLVEGKVEVNVSQKGDFELFPNQMLSIASGLINKQEVDVQKYISWKDNLKIFDNERVGDVLDYIARYYGVYVKYDNTISEIFISGKLDLCDNIENVFAIIEVLGSIKVEKINGDTFTFKKNTIDKENAY